MIRPPKGLGVFAWKRLILTVAVLLFLNGIRSWFTTPQEEDPQLSPRDGIVTVIFPGAPPSDLESLVAKPIEDELAQVDAVKTVTSRLRTDFMFMQVKLKDAISGSEETKSAWDKVQEALDRAAKKLPETAWKPELNKEIYDQDAILLALHGESDSLSLLDHARTLKDRLQSISSVKKIDEVSPPGEQLSIVFEHGALASRGVSLENLVKQLRGGNAAVPSGYVRLGEKKISVLTNSFYRSSDELARFPVVLKSGEVIPLSEIATISRTPTIPKAESMRYNGDLSMGLGVVAQHNVNLKKFGDDVRDAIKEFQATPGIQASGLKIEEVSFQPHYVEERIYDIGLDLLKAIFLVGGALMLMLGMRVGSIVAIQVPVVTAIAFGIFSVNGGVLNQISIAAFILAIGLLVDNVVVVVDGIQSKLDSGLTAIEAGEQTRKEFLVPLAAGTLTTIAAFMPILMARGTVADFTRAIGVVATTALLCSYIFCILCTPIVAAALLRKGKARQWKFVEPLGAVLGSLVKRFPVIIIAVAVVLVTAAAFGFGLVKKQFFPFADRDLIIVDMQLPEGTHYQTTEAAAVRVENELRKDPRVMSVTTLVGRGVPPFYYNLPREPNAAHLAQFIVKTRTKKDAKDLKSEKETALQQLVPYGVLMMKEIAQGPVIRAPIEVRVFSRDPEKLKSATEQTLAAVRNANGLWKVRSTLGTGMMTYRFDVNDSSAGIYGVTRAEVSAVILAGTRGVPVTTFRGADDPYPVTLLSKKGEESTLQDLESSYLGAARTDNISVGTLTNVSVNFTPSVLEHRDRQPVVYVFGEIAPGSSENVATDSVKKQLAEMGSIEGATVEMGGANAESKDANRAIFTALPVGLFLLLLSLMFEFNSFRRVGIILTTIPLCAVGAVPGLILSNSTFGFMTLLGFFTLAGTVIHNGIFLIDYIDHRIHDGVPLDQAITEGIQRRTRPIILTAVATIVELLPMTMSASTLWPPFAWAIISGLSVSTLMTLLVIPSIYKLAFEQSTAPRKVLHTAPVTAGLIVLIAGLTLGFRVEAEREISLGELLTKVKTSPDALSLQYQGQKPSHLSDALWRATFMPKVYGLGMYDHLSTDIGVVNPLSNVPLPLSSIGIPTGPILPSSRDTWLGRAELSQPLLDVSMMFFGTGAASTLAEASRLKASRDVKEQQIKAVGYFLDYATLRGKETTLIEYVKNLRTRQREIQRLYDLGGVSEADLLKVKLGIQDASQGLREIQEKKEFLQGIIAQVTGEQGRLVPADLPEELPKTKPLLAGSSTETFREDIQALKKQIESADLEGRAAITSMLPHIEGYAGITYYQNTFLTSNNWADVGVRLAWPVFDGAVNFARASAATAQRQGLEQKLRGATQALAVEKESAWKSMEIKRQEYDERLQSVEDARRASDLDFNRLRRGKVTVNNVIDAEDTVKDRKEKATDSKVGWYKEWFRYLSALGVEPIQP